MLVETTNVVTQTSLNQTISLEKLARVALFCEYNPQKFSGLVWHYRKLGGTCLVFKSGKLICHGSKTLSDARLVARRYARQIQRLLRAADLRVVNTALLTTSLLVTFDGRFRLDQLPDAFGASYEPELFNAATFRRDRQHFTCFASGRVVITGVKRLSQVQATLIELDMYTEI